MNARGKLLEAEERQKREQAKKHRELRRKPGMLYMNS